jgi:hypothetical protein
LKVPRQCPLVLLVEAAHFIGIRFYNYIFFKYNARGVEISTNIGRAKLGGKNFDVTSGRAACAARSATWNSWVPTQHLLRDRGKLRETF